MFTLGYNSTIKFVISLFFVVLTTLAVTAAVLTFTTTEAEACCGSDGGSSGGPSGGGGPGGGPEGGGGGFIYPTGCKLDAVPNSITKGGSTELVWTTTRATRASLNHGIGNVPIGINRSTGIDSLDQTRTYTMTITDWYGQTKTCHATVLVKQPPVERNCDISVNASVVKYGSSVTVNWNTTGYDTITINGEVVSGTSGNKTYTNLTEDVIYTLRASTDDGNHNCTQQVSVECLPKPVPPKPICESFNAHPQTITKGESATLKWNAKNATGLSINQGIGSVTGKTSQVVKPLQTTTYTLTVFGKENQKVTCPATVTVKPIPDPKTPVCESFTAHPSTITKGGSTTLKWDTKNATALAINNGVGTVTGKTSQVVKPLQTTTYTLHVFGKNNQKDTCPVKVTVNPPAPKPLPVCESFTVSPGIFNNGTGGTVNLAWNTKNTSKVTINHGVGTFTNSNGNTNTVVTAPAGQLPFTKNFTLTAYNSENKSVTCPAATVIVKPIPDPKTPVCESFTAHPSTITKGGSTTLKWDTKNATALAINNGVGTVTGKTSQVVKPLQTTTYTLHVFGKNNQKDTCPVKVTVNPPAPKPLPVCESFTVSPKTLSHGGGTVTLDWKTKNATEVSINNGINAVATNDTITRTVTDTTTFTLTAKNAAGKEVDCSDTVTVTDPIPVPVCESFTVSPKVLSHGGGTVTLDWKTKNATKVSINSGVGAVNKNDSVSRQVTKTTNYILTVENAAGVKNTCPAKVIVKPKEPTPISCEENVSFSANPSSFRRGGDTTLTWSTTGITSVSFNQGINDTRLNGNTTVSPRSNTTYTMTASDGDKTIQCPVPVTVTSSGGGGSVTPRCELTASDRSIKSGERVTLRWDSSRAQDLVLKDSAGKTLVTTENLRARDKDDSFEGSLEVRPTKDTTYTLTVQRGRQERKCEVDITIEGDTIVVVENRDQQPLVSGISLTQVPYTGFEAGPFLTLVFYALLLGWALYLAYVIVIKRTGQSEFAANTASVYTAPVIKESMTAPQSQFTTGAYTRPTFHPAVPTNLPTSDSVVGYANQTEKIEPTIPNLDQTVVAAIENRAHSAHVLLSSDALRYFISTTEGTDRMTVLDKVIAKVTAEYPTEDGWVVLNLERINNACTACMTPVQEVATEVPVGSGSLAEAIVSGNITAAYQMIGHRPMVALADAAADLDAAYRALQGEQVQISDVLANETANLSAEKVQAAIKALTGALDGTYATEEEAVKMAIMKAVKAVS